MGLKGHCQGLHIPVIALFSSLDRVSGKPRKNKPPASCSDLRESGSMRKGMPTSS